MSVHKAQRLLQNTPVANLEIIATEAFPSLEHIKDGTAALAECRRIGEEDAKKIVDALFDTLPGVTLDQIVRFCFERRATYFVVKL